MNFGETIVQNKELLKLLYIVGIGFICFAIVARTHKIFKLSEYQGIRYFRNAFLFYGLGFIIRYLLGAVNIIEQKGNFLAQIVTFTFEFFLIMAGFFLLYSLLWKKFERDKESKSSLFNSRILIFYLLALIISFLDLLWKDYLFMFVSQIILFIIASAIAYNNYSGGGKEHSFLKWYFILMLLNLIAWILNFFVAVVIHWRIRGIVNIYLLNGLIFLIFLYGVFKVTKREK